MFEKIKYQLQLTFELELLKNKHLNIINYELESDGDYVGKEIVHGCHPYTSEFDVGVLEQIAKDAVKDLLERGIYKTLYEVTVDDGAGNSYSYFPTTYCTSFCALCDAMKFQYELLLDYEQEWEDFSILDYLRKNMSVYSYRIEQGDIDTTRLF